MPGEVARQTLPRAADKPVAATRLLQRCACGGHSSSAGQCSSCADKKRRLSRKAERRDAAFGANVQARVNGVLRSPGQPLDPDLGAEMGSLFGRDFSRVRVHADAEAANTATMLNAAAYTVGHHIVFAPGHYQPAEADGRRLLAHELTHVVQQERVADPQGGEIALGPPDDMFERDAERVAELVSAAETDAIAAVTVAPSVAALSAPTIQRKACGPKVDKEVKDVWTKIEDDFSKWPEADAERACSWLYSPLKPDPSGEKRNVPIRVADPIGRPRKLGSITTSINWNVNAFDTLPLFYFGAINWLMNPALLAKGCCDPSISEVEAQAADPGTATANQKICEDEQNPRGGCCSTVEIGGKCWLSGTVNYGTYGIMVRACKKRFPIKLAGIYYLAKGEALAYKKLGHRQGFSGATTKEVAVAEPMSWFEATYAGGPGATPSRAGNRPTCGLTCPLTGAVQPNWDYVWEPIHKRNDPKTLSPTTPSIPP